MCTSSTEAVGVGKQGTLIWNLETHELLVSPTRAANRGATLAIVWITRPDDPDEGVAFGTAQGYLCIWKRTKGEKSVSNSIP
jgi:hypothetical protein